MSENNILGVILAGGKSKRFGKDKSLVFLDNKTLLEHTLEKIESIFPEILIVSNNNNIHYKKKNISITRDCIEGQLGPLVGVLTAMKWIKKSNKNYQWLATFPCDTPFLDTTILKEIKKQVNQKKHLLYFLNSNKKRHNIFGFWSIELINTLEEDIIKNNYRKVEDWANKIGVKNINIEFGKFDPFFNINSIEDLEKAKKILKIIE